jgi:hypothetical protein
MGLTTAGAAVAPLPTHRRGQPWPFLQQAGASANGVPRRQEVEFADGSRLWLLRVERADDLDRLFLRELDAPAGGVLVDLRGLVPEAEAMMLCASTRAVPGLVHMALRSRFGSRDALLQAAVAGGRPA